MSSVYDRADAMTEAFAERLATIVGDRLAGLYLVGSYVLDDLQADSDVDFMAVISGKVPGEQLAELHDWMRSAYPDTPFEGFYVESELLSSSPDAASGSSFIGKKFGEGTKIGLVEWEMLRRHGHVVVGRPVADLGICDASADLPAFSRRNLDEYWEPWLTRTGPFLMKSPVRKHKAWASAWCVLGVPRLLVAIEAGEIVSKSEAGRRARDRFGAEWHAVIDAALDHRQQADKASIKRLAAMGDEALAFSRQMLDAART